jgi:hypothetical protein
MIREWEAGDRRYDAWSFLEDRDSEKGPYQQRLASKSTPMMMLARVQVRPSHHSDNRCIQPVYEQVPTVLQLQIGDAHREWFLLPYRQSMAL